MGRFKSTHIFFEGQIQSIDDLVVRARYHVTRHADYARDILLHLFDHAFKNQDATLHEVCRELMSVLDSPSPNSENMVHVRAAGANNLPPATVGDEQLKAAIADCKTRGLIWAAAGYAVFFRVLEEDWNWKISRAMFEETLKTHGFTDCKPGTLDNAFRNNPFLTSRTEKWSHEAGRNTRKAFLLATAFRKALRERM